MNTKKIISAVCGAVLAVSAAVPAFSASAAEGDFIQITVGISNAGSVEVPNSDLIVYDRDNDGKYTIDEALYCAHEMYYSGGTAGYATEQSDWGLSLKTLWGVTNGGSYGYYVNDTMSMGLSDELKSGDYLYAYVFQDAANFSDKYSFFNYKQKDIKSGETVEATLSALLFDENWAPYTAPVRNARITIDGAEVREIGRGFVVFLGVGAGDTRAEADKLWRKISRMRIFGDETGKTNLALADVDGDVLVVSQFTLYANCKKGNRPSFIEAGSPDHANALYEYIIARCKEQVPVVEKGSFGAEMEVELVNDGPFTILLDSEKL